VIHLDSSVALAHVLAEDRFPAEDLWRQQLVSSRLLEYEVWNRIHARRLDGRMAMPCFADCDIAELSKALQ
jgi:hypothetical protein